MSGPTALAIAVVLLAPVLLTGLPIAFSILLVSLTYLAMTASDLSFVAANMFWFLNKSELMSIPFFILAADILSKSRATNDLVEAAEAVFGRLRGGLALVTMVATIVFSAISGSSVATAIAIGRVMIPKLIDAGYRRRFAVGLVAAGGGLGILVPPSIPLIIYSTVAEISVGDVFLAATGPGLLLGLVFCVFIIAVGDRMRDGENLLATAPARSLKEAAYKIGRALPVLLLPFVILGGIYGGIFTPTEAAAVSVIYAAGLALVFYRRADMDAPLVLVADAGRIAATILLIMAATSVFAYIVTENQVPLYFTRLVEDWNLTAYAFLIFVNLMLLALGCFLEIISVILITVPIFLPVIYALGIDPVQFGVIVAINMELAVITPPIGMNLFVISSISNVPILRVFRGTLPFAAIIGIMLLLVTYSERVVLTPLRILDGVVT